MRTNLIAGLDIGTTKTCAVIGELPEEGGRAARLKILGVGQTRTSGMRGERVTNLEETTASIRSALQEAELMSGVSVDRVYAGLSGEHIEAWPSMGVVAVHDDEVTPGDVNRVHEVARAVALGPDRELLHAIPVEYVVDHQRGIKDPVGMNGTRLEAEVHLVSCSATAAGNLRKAVTRAGYAVQELVLAPLATARAVLTEDEKEVGAAMVEIGAATTEMAVYYEGKLRHVAVIPVAGTAVTTDLVKGLSIPFAEARRAKETFGAASGRFVDPHETVEVPGPAPGQMRHVARELIAHIAEQRLDELFGLVQRELDRSNLADKLGAGVVITGGSAALPGVIDLAEQVFAAPVRLGVPGEGLGGLADSVGRPRFAAAVGLTLWGGERFHQTGEGATTVASAVVSKVSAWLREFF
ncbi:cell division protein FtsA [Gaopeijia maritima]|uniref:Cell division protein FtsA n=1 Tax=Gaopeijia maritima TaxID=3119007 RepID=A0ABU9EEZ6_9BACT